VNLRRRKHIYTGGTWTEVPVYGLEDLAPGHEIAGPAVIEAETTTVILHAGDQSSVTPLGWLDIKVALRRSSSEESTSAQDQGLVSRSPNLQATKTEYSIA
jgi:Hydantoinase/oxoprolinase C-terminal domain